ncbi:MAG: hypothetical protein L6V95_14860 [Candidatus Melainabacteria bacterium]|nr:MAG: hypothetical protein L6V95_14860 [Candidatus Melainabacteria bacterium]
MNLACELDKEGVLKEYNVEVLGTTIESIKMAEDRELFKNLMLEINEPVPESAIVSSFEEADKFYQKNRFAHHYSSGIHSWRKWRGHCQNL